MSIGQATDHIAEPARAVDAAIAPSQPAMSRGLFNLCQAALTLFFLPIYCVLIGISLAPGLALTLTLWGAAAAHGAWAQALAIGIGLGVTYFLGGMLLLIVMGLAHRALPLKVKPGVYPINSTTTLKWAVTGSIIKLVKHVFLPMATPSGFNMLFFRLMGAKIGKGVWINSIEINDPSMLEFGDGAVVGGSARINGHTVEKGMLILAPVKLGAGATIGAGAIVWAGTSVGDRAVVAARAVVSKNTTIGDGEIWGGMPAKFLRRRGEAA